MNTSTYPEYYDEINRVLREIPPLANEGQAPKPAMQLQLSEHTDNRIFVGSGDIHTWEMCNALS